MDSERRLQIAEYINETSVLRGHIIVGKDISFYISHRTERKFPINDNELDELALAIYDMREKHIANCDAQKELKDAVHHFDSVIRSLTDSIISEEIERVLYREAAWKMTEKEKATDD